MLLRLLLKPLHLFLATTEDSHYVVVDMKPQAVAITNFNLKGIRSINLLAISTYSKFKKQH